MSDDDLSAIESSLKQLGDSKGLSALPEDALVRSLLQDTITPILGKVEPVLRAGSVRRLAKPRPSVEVTGQVPLDKLTFLPGLPPHGEVTARFAKLEKELRAGLVVEIDRSANDTIPGLAWLGLPKLALHLEHHRAIRFTSIRLTGRVVQKSGKGLELELAAGYAMRSWSVALKPLSAQADRRTSLADLTEFLIPKTNPPAFMRDLGLADLLDSLPGPVKETLDAVALREIDLAYDTRSKAVGRFLLSIATAKPIVVAKDKFVIEEVGLALLLQGSGAARTSIITLRGKAAIGSGPSPLRLDLMVQRSGGRQARWLAGLPPDAAPIKVNDLAALLELASAELAQTVGGVIDRCGALTIERLLVGFQFDKPASFRSLALTVKASSQQPKALIGEVLALRDIRLDLDAEKEGRGWRFAATLEGRALLGKADLMARIGFQGGETKAWRVQLFSGIDQPLKLADLVGGIATLAGGTAATFAEPRITLSNMGLDWNQQARSVSLHASAAWKTSFAWLDAAALSFSAHYGQASGLAATIEGSLDFGGSTLTFGGRFATSPTAAAITVDWKSRGDGVAVAEILTRLGLPDAAQALPPALNLYILAIGGKVDFAEKSLALKFEAGLKKGAGAGHRLTVELGTSPKALSLKAALSASLDTLFTGAKPGETLPAELRQFAIENATLLIEKRGRAFVFSLAGKASGTFTIGSIAIAATRIALGYNKPDAAPPAEPKPDAATPKPAGPPPGLSAAGDVALTLGKGGPTLGLTLAYSSVDGLHISGGLQKGTSIDLAAIAKFLAEELKIAGQFDLGPAKITGLRLDLRIPAGLGATRLALAIRFKGAGNDSARLYVIARRQDDATGWSALVSAQMPPILFGELPLVGPAITKAIGALPPDLAKTRPGVTGLEVRYGHALKPGDGKAHEDLDGEDFPGAAEIVSGWAVKGRLTLPGLDRDIAYPAATKPPTPADTGDAGLVADPHKDQGKKEQDRNAAAKPPAADDASWIDVNRSLAFVTLDRIGVRMGDGGITVMVDAGAKLGPVQLGFTGLGATAALKWPPQGIKPQLRGVSVGATTKALTIAGALTADGANEYAGMLQVGFGKIALKAVGTYTTHNNEPSFVVFAVLDVPLGGPPEFFVTGLAAGIGYNRKLPATTVDQVDTHPFILAAGGGKTPPDPLKVVKTLKDAIRPMSGEIFVAAGIRFSTYKLVESIVMLTASFGSETRFGILGRSELSFPPAVRGVGVDPLVFVELSLLADIRPAAGEIKVFAQIGPKSFLFDKNARLSGGFAFCLWFGRHPAAGDFVITLGGYHPRFKPRPHYPVVPAVALNWQVSPQLAIKGSIYFALTPMAIMFGGALSVTWHSGSIRAWFTFNADFIVYFQPFRFEAAIAVSIGVEGTIDAGITTIRIRQSVNVDLQVEGPPFRGIARAKVMGVRVAIPIGDQRARANPVITWLDFRKTFLPLANPGERKAGERKPGEAKPTASPTVTDALITLSAPRGLLDRVETRPAAPHPAGIRQEVWRVAPAGLAIEIGISIPATDIRLSNNIARKPGPDGAAPTGWSRFGIRPIGAAPGDVESILDIRITSPSGVSAWLSAETAGRIPNGLWGSSSDGPDGPSMIENARVGLTLEPGRSDAGGAEKIVDWHAEQANPGATGRQAWWVRTEEAATDSGSLAAFGKSIASAGDVRAKILAGLAVKQQDIARRLADKRLGHVPPPPLASQGSLAGFAKDCATLMDGVPATTTWGTP